MSGMKIAGIILIVLGALALGYQKFSYNKKHELFKIGDASATVTARETKSIPPWVGFVAVGAGVALLVIPRKKA